MPTSTYSFQNQSIFNQLVLLLFLAMVGSFVASLLVQGVGQWLGMDYVEVVKNIQANAPLTDKNFIKLTLCLSTTFTFILPAFIFLFIIYQKDWRQAAHLHKSPALKNALLGGLFLVIAFPFVQFIYSINKQFPMPDWAIEQENLINTTLRHLLYVQSPLELVINIVVIALLPAIGEELLFRGILQQKLEKGTQNAHLAIWGTALIFSFIHFQFQGFLPRLFLGGILGYLFLWTRNLWVPIIAHFIYNGGQVLLQYLNQQDLVGIQLDEIETVPIWLVGISLVGMFFLAMDLYREEV